MKPLLILLLFPLFASGQMHTTATIEAGTTNFSNQAYTAMIGFTNFEDDSFHAGPLYKRYGSEHRTGLRLNVNLSLNNTLFIFIQSDMFPGANQPHEASFLENSAGLGLGLFKGLSLNAGYQMEDYNPVTEIRSEDQVLVKLGYKIRL